jgi:hypothetical protein
MLGVGRVTVFDFQPGRIALKAKAYLATIEDEWVKVYSRTRSVMPPVFLPLFRHFLWDAIRKLTIEKIVFKTVGPKISTEILDVVC